jgi:hypothetical protein
MALRMWRWRRSSTPSPTVSESLVSSSPGKQRASGGGSEQADAIAAAPGQGSPGQDPDEHHVNDPVRPVQDPVQAKDRNFDAVPGPVAVTAALGARPLVRGDGGRLNGLGVVLAYGPQLLTIRWANGSALDLKFGHMALDVRLEPNGPGVAALWLRLDMTKSPGSESFLEVVLPFPAEITAEVEAMAQALSALTASHGGGAPHVRQPGQPGTDRADSSDSPTAAARPERKDLAPPTVLIDAGPTLWVDQPDWAGLYPPGETVSLLRLTAEPGQSAT